MATSNEMIAAERGLGAMVPPREKLAPGASTPLVGPDGRPTAEFRSQLRRIPSWRNALSVVLLYAQTAAVLWFAVRFGPYSWPFAFILMGRAHAQFASLMHEAAHRLLLANRRLNDFVGRWLLGFPSFTSTDAYRRVHMAHHREEFGPNEPDIPLYAGYPVGRASLRRKLWRDALGRTGYRLFGEQAAGFRSDNPMVRRTLWQIVGVQVALLAAAIVSGYWWLYPFFWLLPYLTVWRVINRLRSIAEHGGMHASADRRETTHTVAQHALARFLLVPYRIGWHLAHHVDAGVPFRNLPQLHRALAESGYVNPGLEYPSYPAIWKALAAEPSN